MGAALQVSCFQADMIKMILILQVSGKGNPTSAIPIGKYVGKTLERYYDSMGKCRLAARRNFVVCLVVMGLLVAYTVQRILHT